MELIVIGENRLKIMLTGEDMARYDLTEPDPLEESAHSVTPHTREVLRHIFADAHSQIGFDTEGERLFVQLYASKGGGCEIFVTKLGDTGESKLLKRVMGKDKVYDARGRLVWLQIDRLEDLTALCRRLVATGFHGDSHLYISPSNEQAWYLSLHIPEEQDSSLLFPFLAEYGDEMREEAGLYLGEYGKLICSSSAVETMARI